MLAVCGLLNVGNGTIVIGNVVLIPSTHEFNPLTTTSPDATPLPKLTLITFVFNPDVITAPVGNVQSYVVAFGITGTLNS